MKRLCCFLTLGILLVASVSCSDHIIENKECDVDHYNIYKYDSIRFPVKDKVDLCGNDAFNFIDSKLFLSKPDEIVERVHKIKVNGVDKEVKIRDWKETEYKLSEFPFDNKYPLLLKGDTSFYVESHFLKYNVNGEIVVCCKFYLTDVMYKQMVTEYGWYAIRTGNAIFVSQDLRNWMKIYQEKRGISKSMAFVVNKQGHVELLFSEYTPGVERVRHHIYKYDCKTKQTRTVFTFYKSDENMLPCARHIHILEKDPYSGDIWVGTGDSDQESHVYRSTDNGETFSLMGSGSQKWRVLSFIFTPEYVFWNVDSPSPQYLTRIGRSDLGDGIVSDSDLRRFSIINSACWGTLDVKTSDGEDMIIMSSNNEGGIYDNYCRTYGVIIKNGIPTVYELTRIEARTIYTQMFPIGVDNEKNLYFCDHEIGEMHKFRLTKMQ